MASDQIEMLFSLAYPHTPGFKACGTSQDAAKAMEPSAPDLRALALAHISSTPSTSDETAAAIGASVLAVRPRISELRAADKIKIKRDDAGKAIRRKNSSGQTANVWEAT